MVDQYWTASRRVTGAIEMNLALIDSDSVGSGPRPGNVKSFKDLPQVASKMGELTVVKESLAGTLD